MPGQTRGHRSLVWPSAGEADHLAVSACQPVGRKCARLASEPASEPASSQTNGRSLVAAASSLAARLSRPTRAKGTRLRAGELASWLHVGASGPTERRANKNDNFFIYFPWPKGGKYLLCAKVWVWPRPSGKRAPRRRHSSTLPLCVLLRWSSR